MADENDLNSDEEKSTEIAEETHNDEEDNLGEYRTSSYGPKISPPITLLQEICSRNGFTAEYQLLSTEGSVHEPTFKIAVTVADITVTASGQSKKKARHAAAREAIEKLRQRDNLNVDGINFDSITSVGEPPGKSVYAMASNEANPVGKLQEICMKMRVNPPDYDTCYERGLAHERIFVLKCTIASLNMTTLGEGRSKKLAKRQAAEHMLAKLENSEIYDKTANSKSADQSASSINMDLDDNSHFVRTRRLVTELCTQLDCTVDDLWTDIKMIETDDVNEELFYELYHETIRKIGYHCQFHYITDYHCLLHTLDADDNIRLTSFGFGHNNFDAMRNSVINSYKLMMVLLKPLTGTDSLQRHRAAGTAILAPDP